MTSSPKSTWSVSGIIWITGLSGSGKTSLAKKLRSYYQQKGINSIHLDGDELREVLGVKGGYDSGSRLSLGMVYARLARLLALQGNLVIVSTIALFDEIHRYNREFRSYCEIFLESDQALLAKGDSKAVYRNDGLPNRNVVGVDLQPQFPKSPHRKIPNSPISHNAINIEELFSFTISFMDTDEISPI